MTVEPYIVDAEIVDETENTGTATGLRGRARRARTAVSKDRIRERSGAARSDVALVADGVRGRRLRQYEHERMAEYRHNGNPDSDVRDDLRPHYEREKDRRERAAANDDGETSLADMCRYAAWAGVAVGELLLLALVFGGLSGWYAAVAVLVGIANVVAVPVLWRRFRREGQTYRDKHAAWKLGQAPSEERDEDHSAGSLTGMFVEAGIVRDPERGGQGVSLAEPVSSDTASWSAQVILPRGITVGQVRRKLEPLASAVDVYPQQIQISQGESERRLSLRVFRQLPFTGEPVRSPLAGAQHSRPMSAGIPVGTDIHGTAVELHPKKAGLVVSSSGNGKSVLIQNICSATVLDTTASLSILDGKPDGSYTQYRELCEHYVTSTQDGWQAQAADVLEKLANEELDRRLAASERHEDYGGRHEIIIDEFQEFTGSLSGEGMGKGEPKRRIRDAMDRLARKGRSVDMLLVLATQHYDGRILDNGVLANIGWRAVGFCDSDTSRAALGELAKRFGIDTSVMFVDMLQAGAFLVAGAGVHPYRTMRGYLQTPDEIRATVATAHQLRDAIPSATGDTPDDSAHQDATESSEATLDDDTAALLRAVLEVYGNDDADWIPATTLVAEVAAGELGWANDRTTEMAVSETLLAAGATKKRTTAAGAGKPMSWDRATLVDACRQALGE